MKGKSTFLHLLGGLLLCSNGAVACKKTETVTLPSPTAAPVAQTPPASPPSPATAPVAQNPPAGVRVERITLAKSVNEDASPVQAETTFASGETIYVSMWTPSVPVGTVIAARWFKPDGWVTEERIMTDRTADYLSFHAHPPDGNGWAPGTYRVEIIVNGASAGSTTFTVS